MVHEMLVALTVTDAEKYDAYRAAMAPILDEYGGGFRYDFDVATVRKTASDHAINRVFTIYFRDRAAKDAFFADPRYLDVRAKFFETSVAGTSLVGAWDR
jgi:uncharacterized protein (DUF1330 family)